MLLGDAALFHVGPCKQRRFAFLRGHWKPMLAAGRGQLVRAGNEMDCMTHTISIPISGKRVYSIGSKLDIDAGRKSSVEGFKRPGPSAGEGEGQCAVWEQQ